MKNDSLIFGKRIETHQIKKYCYNVDKNYNITFQNEQMLREQLHLRKNKSEMKDLRNEAARKVRHGNEMKQEKKIYFLKTWSIRSTGDNRDFREQRKDLEERCEKGKENEIKTKRYKTWEKIIGI